VEWRPYDLHPEYPWAGLPLAERAARLPEDYGEAIRELFAAAGFPYAPHPTKVPRTRLALELGEAARVDGAHDAYHDAVMDAYWTHGRDISEPAVLGELATAAGVSAEATAFALEERAFSDAVDLSTAIAQRSGIFGVPAFVIDRAVLVSGAQPHAVFTQAITTAARHRT
jgi:predicted DsbA family dithiol-disulfide isomerase